MSNLFTYNRLYIYCFVTIRKVLNVDYTECPKIYRKSVLHLLQYTANLYISRYSRELL